jgi:hypothetical protein
MKHYYYPFLLALLITPGFSIASENQNLPEINSLDDDEDIGYGDNVCEYEDDDDEEEIPENVFETRYSNGRMAFLFGKFDIAYKAWEPLAQQGYAKAQASLGWMYHTGNGVKKDIQQALGWYTLAAAQGHAIAQNNLGVFYENGLGTIPDAKAAFEWYKKSATSGYAYAQYNLGRLYAEGVGTRKNEKEARYWLQSALLHKVKEAESLLAQLDNRPPVPDNKKDPKQKLAHAPYHSNPVAKGINWVKNQAVNHYTIQLTRSQDMDWILKVASSEQLPLPIVQFQTKDAKSGNWIYLIYGSFPSFKDAQLARKELPESLKKWNPKLLRFGEVHQLLKKN